MAKPEIILGVYLYPDLAKKCAKGTQVKHISLTTTAFCFKINKTITIDFASSNPPGFIQENFLRNNPSRVTDPFHTLTFGNAISRYKPMPWSRKPLLPWTSWFGQQGRRLLRRQRGWSAYAGGVGMRRSPSGLPARSSQRQSQQSRHRTDRCVCQK